MSKDYMVDIAHRGVQWWRTPLDNDFALMRAAQGDYAGYYDYARFLGVIGEYELAYKYAKIAAVGNMDGADLVLCKICNYIGRFDESIKSGNVALKKGFSEASKYIDASSKGQVVQREEVAKEINRLGHKSGMSVGRFILIFIIVVYAFYDLIQLLECLLTWNLPGVFASLIVIGIIICPLYLIQRKLKKNKLEDVQNDIERIKRNNSIYDGFNNYGDVRIRKSIYTVNKQDVLDPDLKSISLSSVEMPDYKDFEYYEKTGMVYAETMEREVEIRFRKSEFEAAVADWYQTLFSDAENNRKVREEGLKERYLNGEQTEEIINALKYLHNLEYKNGKFEKCTPFAPRITSFQDELNVYIDRKFCRNKKEDE